MEAGAVAADGVAADGGRGVLELLRDVFDQRLAVQALEGPADLRWQRQHGRFTNSSKLLRRTCKSSVEKLPARGERDAFSPPDR